MTVVVRYFIGESDRCKEIAKAALEKRAAYWAACEALANTVGANSLAGYEGRSPRWVIFKKGEAPEKGFIFDRDSDEGKVEAYKPDRRTKVGRALSDEMRKLEEPEVSDWVCFELGVYRTAITTLMGHAVFISSVCGVSNEKLFISVPFGNADEFNLSDDGVTIPEDFREVLGAEWRNEFESKGTK